MTGFFFFFGKITVFEGWGKDKKKKNSWMFLWFHTHWQEGPSSRRATDLYLISHVRSHGGAFLLPVFFFFFSGKNLSLFCVGGKHKQYIYIYPLSLFCLPSFCCYTSFPFLPIFLQRYPVCLSLSLFFFRRNPLSLYQSPLLFFLFPPSLSSLTLCLPRIFFAMWARRLILLISPDSIIGCLPAQLSTAHII